MTRRISLICAAILLAATVGAMPVAPFHPGGKAVSAEAAAAPARSPEKSFPPLVSSAKDWAATPVTQKWRNNSGYSSRGPMGGLT